jgi:hypothetical protein
MIDSVLKGTGNSRFLKSAVPAGTSWADALAMLQAGTFPIDLNGINNAGFQQVGTPLNKANLLKDATAAQIGLPPSTTPDGMFQALGNTGELHVWRKTTVTTEPVPAGYKLGDVLTHGSSYIACQINGSSYVNFVIQEATSITVNDNGIIEASWGSNISVAYGDSYTFTPNRFVKIVSINANAINSNFAAGDVVWVPSDGKIHGTYVQQNDGAYLYYLEFTKCQKVNAHGIIPAGTTTTYPVSTKPNAYQEGSDAKPAGYTLGEVVSGKFRVSSSYVQGDAYWKYGTSLTVSDDGTVNIANPSSVSLSGSSSSVASNAQQMAGKYAVCTSVSDTGYEPDFPIGTVVFFPSDTLFTRLDSSCWASKYQPVTGYAAIPAGTTIEYLGKLGDKARVQVVSYVGTGTYGEDNPCSLTFDFVAKFIMELGSSSGKEGIYFPGEGGVATIPNFLDNDYRSRCGFGDLAYSWCKKSTDGKTITWYSTRDQYKQENSAGVTYYYVAIG